MFSKEADFEDAVIHVLTQHGWDSDVLMYPTEDDLIANWARILFENNRGIDQLNNQPLTDTEMQQVLEQVTAARTPLALNGFINGKTISITRDNPADPAHLGKEVSLKIYDRHEIAAGQSRYQIARQPKFPAHSALLPTRRGDLLLLINGMPVIHLELKRTGVAVSEAINQIKKYAHEGVFSGIMSLVQIFVAMNPEETRYFANPGPDGTFSSGYFFHWADFNNEPMNAWQQVTVSLLSIPMAHQLIGFYTVADDSDGVLKVMRSYQFWAANRIADTVAKHDWHSGQQRGGYIWHTTGSGKTMTSFKSAQLVANSGDADKVIFLVDRIELGTQSLNEYRAFAEATDAVQATENTGELISRLTSAKPTDTLIVTSIQKMNNVAGEHALRARDLEKVRGKRIVFIVDECHRSTFGEMLARIKELLPDALFFGFTGTPIHEENQKKEATTSAIFGNELHRYSIADGIRDGNVLGFDTVRYQMKHDLRSAIVLRELGVTDDSELQPGSKGARLYLDIMHNHEAYPMGHPFGDKPAAYKWAIEDKVPAEWFDNDTYRSAVVEAIQQGWNARSRLGMFHAILATSSIPEAIEYYRVFKRDWPELAVTALFDPSIDNTGEGQLHKEDGLVEIITDYNARYDRDFTIPTFASMKQDIALRLAHKKQHKGIENRPAEQIDLLIVVDQMLTGFDSKWINTLYLDKVLRYENIIQAFSRTNRLFGPDKPFGTICYFRKAYTMENAINAAVKLYSGDRPLDLFSPKVDAHMAKMDEAMAQIRAIFRASNQPDLAALPDDASCPAFAAAFRELNRAMEAARVQGWRWETPEYQTVNAAGENETRTLGFDETTYLTVALRYQEYRNRPQEDPGPGDDTPPIVDDFDIDVHINAIDTQQINSTYMSANFTKWLKALSLGETADHELAALRAELHRSFASLPAEQQKYAEIVIHDVESGDLTPREDWSFLDYVVDYQRRAHDDRLHRLASGMGVDESALGALIQAAPTRSDLDEFGRFQALMDSTDMTTFRQYLAQALGETDVSPFGARKRLAAILTALIVDGTWPDGRE